MRFCFVLSIAVPQFVSLLIMRTMLQPTGIVNTLLLKYGLIDTALPFFSNATWARVTVIVINLWVGIPYTLLQVTGILQNIPGELYEAAKIDGANAVQTFFKITLPYMLFVMTPYLITQFTEISITSMSSSFCQVEILLRWMPRQERQTFLLPGCIS